MDLQFSGDAILRNNRQGSMYSAVGDPKMNDLEPVEPNSRE